MSTMKSLIHLQPIPGIAPEKNELYRAEISDRYKRRAELKKNVSEEEYAIKQLHRLDAESRGVEPAFIDKTDLIKIIGDLLANKPPVSKAFERHEVNEGLCAGWAKRTISYSVDKFGLNSAFDMLVTNAEIILMEKYKVMDIKEILRSASYSAALTKLKKQLDIANTLQNKDNQLVSKDSVIAGKDAEIEKLNTELQRDKSEDWETRVFELTDAGISVTDIAARVGKVRATVYAALRKRKLNLKLLSD